MQKSGVAKNYYKGRLFHFNYNAFKQLTISITASKAYLKLWT